MAESFFVSLSLIHFEIWGKKETNSCLVVSFEEGIFNKLRPEKTSEGVVGLEGDVMINWKVGVVGGLTSVSLVFDDGIGFVDNGDIGLRNNTS